ncbi:MAG: adenylate/guanylate cyclase domain-containing protein [Desulfamplus sp.]|nr:adenylate/guanylate cyclase domain-containing protein [Desulfamplus sp.]
MNFIFRNRRQSRTMVLFTLVLLMGWGLIFALYEPVWHKWDYKALDYIYKLSVNNGHGPEPSFAPGIIYLPITDDTYDAFGTNHLDRGKLAPVNLALAELDVEGIVYDIIFARAGTPDSDALFAESIEAAGCVHLPSALARSDDPVGFKWNGTNAHERIKNEFSGVPGETNIQRARPIYASRALTQYDPFAAAAISTGDIAVNADGDSIYRHACLLTRMDGRYFPTLALSVFLSWSGAAIEDLEIAWGETLTIPALPHTRLHKDVVIPIDSRGCTFIPYVRPLGQDFSHMPVHQFMEYFKTPHLRGNLLDWFEGRFVIIGDLATGAADMGYTPLEADASLMVIHASLLNALLTSTFYRTWCGWQAGAVVLLTVLCIGVSACLGPAYPLYAVGILSMGIPLLLAWTEMIQFRLFPVTTVLAGAILTFGAVLGFREISASRESAFIRTVFGRYVPEKVVRVLLNKPEMVVLGGEEREVSILFSDIKGFTAISESLEPAVLVMLLNEYFSEMAEIIFHHDGIIDKFQGDAVMAEFGMPAPSKNHADQAVAAAISMQHRLNELRDCWKKRGVPELFCRIGINSGPVIAGNMGARNIMDYTVMGDAVNVAARLEQANKLYGTSIIISRDTRNLLTSGRFNITLLDTIQVKGRSQSVTIYEVKTT